MLLKNTSYSLYYSNNIRLKLSVIAFFIIGTLHSQSFSKYDYLHGKLTKFRTCYDVKTYEITVKVDPEKKFISGKNEITFLTMNDAKKIQLDFFANMKIEKIEHGKEELKFERDSNACFVSFKNKLIKGSTEKIIVYFSGNPIEAKNAPWDGGFVWKKDRLNNDWVGLACEGIGASCWLPCKDHLSDEAETMLMHLQVPDNLVGVSNGKFVGELRLQNGFKQFDWQVSYPINNYNITINVANYTRLQDHYTSTKNGVLNLDYYILQGHEADADKHFKQCKTMLASFEKYFGPYPFWDDGYKLVETDYWGMEHQSCVSYGNHFSNNKFGFDFIIVHESGHEWFGNSISCNDAADMWLHESFTTYAEALYVESTLGKEKAIEYLLEQKQKIKNQQAMIGIYDVSFHNRKDNDIYYKGSWMLHTMRNMLNNDTLWMNSLYDLSIAFKRKIASSKMIEDFLIKRTGYDFSEFFLQYLHRATLPVFEYKIKKNNAAGLELQYRLKSNVRGLEMPIRASITKNSFSYLIAESKWRSIELSYTNPDDFKIDLSTILIDVKKLTD